MDKLVEAQRARIGELEERVRQLEAAIFNEVRPPVEWGLTGSEARVFSVLARKPMATKEAVMTALYSDRVDIVEPKIVDVFICKIRKKLNPFGVQITTVWGQGYSLVDREKYLEGSR